MKVAVFGGTGFVGSYIIDNLLAEGHTPKLLVRSESIYKVPSVGDCELIIGDVNDEEAVKKTVKEVDAVIYTIGIIREFKSKGITYENLHFGGAVNSIDAALAAGVERFVLMSANGVCPDGTGYQKTKWMSEQYLKNTGLKWTIFRPSTIFGDPRGNGRPEFCSQLKKDLINLPLPAPLFHEGLVPFNAGNFSMSPVHIADVSKSFVSSLTNEKSILKTIELGGKDFTWKQIIKTIGSAAGKKKLMVPAPVIAVKSVATALDRFSWFPVTADQLTMLVEGNTCDSSKYFSENKIEPIPFNEENLSYLGKD
ncbi:MAG: NAD(P)H-binding protein [Candidatus Neomarinimicrobiota bacterium]